MHWIEACVRNPVKVSVGVLLVGLFGCLAVFRMPMQLTPEVEIPAISVSTRWPGASPEEIEREIVQKQEEQLQRVEGVTKMTANCSHSFGRVTLEFKVGTDLSEALLRVNSRLQQVREYPEEADEPVISGGPSEGFMAWFMLCPRVASLEQIAAFLEQHSALRPVLEPVGRAQNSLLAARRLLNLTARRPELAEPLRELLPPKLDMPTHFDFAEEFVAGRFERVPGVASANAFGGREREMQVIVDPQRLAARGLTVTDVRRALRQQNRDISGGDLSEGKRRYVVRTLGRFRNPEDVASVILARSGGGAVYLRDVAEVRLGYKKPTNIITTYGLPYLSVGCYRRIGVNSLETMAAIRKVTTELNDGVLKERGMLLIQLYDETEYINSALNLVQDNLVIGGFLTIFILLLFLRSSRPTLIIGLAIPISLIGTFLLLNLLGRSLNVISLAGLAFAVGMLVDNAIVVLENVFRRHQLGETAAEATVRGTKEVWGAVLASTLTTLAVFLPVVFMEEATGQLFRDIALAISAAVGLSLIVSLTVIPSAAARLLRRRQVEPAVPTDRTNPCRNTGGPAPGLSTTLSPSDGERAGVRGAQLDAAASAKVRDTRLTSAATASLLRPLDRAATALVGGLLRFNAFLLRSTPLRLAAVTCFVAVSLGLSWLLMPKLEYLPTGNRNMVLGQVLPPPGYNSDRLLELGEKLTQLAKPYWDIDRNDPNNKKLDYPPVDNYFVYAAFDRVYFGLRAVDGARAAELIPLARKLGEQAPGTIAFASQMSIFQGGLMGGRSVDIEITGPELPKLIELGREVFALAPQAVPQAQAFPRPSLDLSTPELHVVRKLDQASALEVGTDELGYTVDALVDGAYATDYYLGGDRIDLTIIGSPQFARRTHDLESLPVATAFGQLVRLGGLADVKLAGGPQQINRRERQRAITVTVAPPKEMPLGMAIDAINEKIVEPLRQRGAIGGEYQISLSGTADKLQAAWQALRWNLLLALLITYLLMAALFESWLYPLVIIVSVPLGMVGGLAGLALLNVYLALLPHPSVQALDVLTMLGFVILIGTVVNNPILIVHQSLNHLREGMGMREAILESTRTRIRPIFMTTLTTVVGLLPLVLVPGAGSELYRGLGAVILGGLVFSTAFTLVLVPIVFSLALKAKAAFLRRWKRQAIQEAIPRQEA